jgi:hypothetical protein
LNEDIELISTPRLSGIIGRSIFSTRVRVFDPLPGASVGTANPPVSVKLKITPRSLNFGTVRAGNQRGPRYINVLNLVGNKKNPGMTVNIQGVRLNGAFLPFGIVNGCPPTLPPGGGCWVALTYAPNVAGIDKGTLQIFDNAEAEPQSVKLSGRSK